MQIQSSDIEKSLLASISWGSFELTEELEESDFSVSENKRLFSLFKERQSKITNSELINLGFKESFLAEIIAVTPLSNAKEYTKLLREYAGKRTLDKCLQLALKSLQNDTLANVSDDLVANITNILSRDTNVSLKNAKTVVKELANYHDEMRAKKSKGLIGIATGLDNLDEKTKGLKKGELCILSARPGMGKTTLALNFFENAIKEGKRALFISLEMSALQLMQRLVASRCYIELGKLSLANLTTNEEEEMIKACNFYKEQDFLIFDKGSLSLKSLKAILRGLKANNKLPSLIILDYLSLMQGGEKQSRYEAVSDISRGLKSLAMDLDIPILALAQLNRQVEIRQDKKPNLSDLRESGSIEQDADTVLFIHNAGKDGLDDFKLIIAKNRHGENGTLDLGFDKAYARMYTRVNMNIGYNVINYSE